jgi:hypothetical protein
MISLSYNGRYVLFMIYGILSHVIIIVHLLWIVFLVAGSYWGIRRRPVMMIHGTGLVFALISQVFGWHCPITLLQLWLQKQHSAAQAYPCSFIAYYAEKLVYIDLSPRIISALTLAPLGVTTCIYWRVYKKTAARSLLSLADKYAQRK